MTTSRTSCHPGFLLIDSWWSKEVNVNINFEKTKTTEPLKWGLHYFLILKPFLEKDPYAKIQL